MFFNGFALGIQTILKSHTRTQTHTHIHTYIVFSFTLHNIHRFHTHSRSLPPPFSPRPTHLPSPGKENVSQGHQINKGTTRYKTRHNPSYKGWVRQPTRRKRVAKTVKRVEIPLQPLSGVLLKHQSNNLNNPNIHGTDRAWTGTALSSKSDHLSPAYLIQWAVALIVSLTLLSLTIRVSSLLWGFPGRVLSAKWQSIHKDRPYPTVHTLYKILYNYIFTGSLSHYTFLGF